MMCSIPQASFSAVPGSTHIEIRNFFKVECFSQTPSANSRPASVSWICLSEPMIKKPPSRRSFIAALTLGHQVQWRDNGRKSGRKLVAKRVGISEKLESVPSLPLGTNEINIFDIYDEMSKYLNIDVDQFIKKEFEFE